MISERWKHVRALFNEAIDLSPDERIAFLDEACAGDPEVRADVEALLGADADLPPVLQASPDDLAALLPATPSSAQKGKQIGAYRLVRRIGHGGMGEVFLAERADGQFEKQVALKLVKRGMDSEEILRRFRYERQILAALEHPHIARLYDGGISDDGRPYLVMEYAGGQTIDAYCDAKRLNVEERLRLFQHVCEAVQYAHQNLVVHRDLKPSNMLVTEDGDVKLLDFGIAKLLDEEALGLSVPMTRTGVRMMTPEYASPEQVRGEMITTATDVYALGVVLYELLTGHRPFNLSDMSLLEAEHTILEREPERPSAAVTKVTERRRQDGTTKTVTPEAVGATRATSVDRLQRRLQGDLDTMLLKALRKEPARRYPSAEAFLEDIKRHLAGLPVAARPDTVGYRLSKFARRHRVGVGLGGLVLLLVVGFAVAITLQEAATARARDEAEAVAVFLEDLFAAPDPFSTSPERIDTLRVRDMLGRGTEKVRQELATQPAVQARMLYVLGRVYYKMGLYDEARPLLEEALASRRSLYESEHLTVAETLQSLAGVFEETGDYAAAESLYQEALAIRQVIQAKEHPDVAQVMGQLGYIYRLTGDFDRAEPLIRRALAIGRKQIREPDVAFANSLTRFGIMLQEKGDYPAAVTVHQEALAVRRRRFKPSHPRLATSIMNLAVVLTQNGDYAGAEPPAREALSISRKAAQDEAHVKTAFALHALAVILDETGRDEEAHGLFQEALAMFMQLFGEDHRRIASTLLGLGSVASDLNDLDAAEAYYRRALAIIHRVLGDTHPLVVSALDGFADLHRRRGAYDVAAATAREALILSEALSPEHPRTASVRHTLARIAYDQGDLEQATTLLRTTHATQQRVLPADHPDALETESWLGACLSGLGQYQEAEQWLLHSYETLVAKHGERHPHTQHVLAHLVVLYEAWGKPAEAAEYRSLLTIAASPNEARR